MEKAAQNNIEEIEIYSKRAKKHANNNYFESDNKTHHSCKGSIHNVVVFSIAQMLCIQYEPGENKSSPKITTGLKIATDTVAKVTFRVLWLC